jgi:N-acetylmuramoyl-L-alanine amidase
MKRLVLTLWLPIVLGCAQPRGVIRDLPPPVMNTEYVAHPEPEPLPSPVEKPPAPEPLRMIGPKTIVVDPGHGGKDPGTQGLSPIPEETFNLLMARELTQELSRRNAKVIPTRTSDRFLALETRAAVAQRARADLFVSIHADYSPKRSNSGATLYIARKASRASVRAADCIAAAFRQHGVPYKGTRRADFRVLTRHSRPAVLIECGYMSNRADARRLNSATFRSRLAKAIADGIAAYAGN